VQYSCFLPSLIHCRRNIHTDRWVVAVVRSHNMRYVMCSFIHWKCWSENKRRRKQQLCCFLWNCFYEQIKWWWWWLQTRCFTYFKVAQLSQRDRAAGWISFNQKWKTIFCRHYRFIVNQCDVIGLQSYQIRWNNSKVIQGHRCRYQSKARMRLSISD